MIPIAECPSVVTSYLPAFESVFTKPQMKNFARYTTGLMISPNRTVSAMNDLFYGHNDQSALNNFVTDSTWSDDDARYRVILDGLNRRSRDCEGDGIFVMDDTLSHKTGKRMEYAGKFFDHAEGKYTHAHDIMTTHLVKGRLSIPLDFRVYIKKEEFEEKKREEEEEERPAGERFEDKNRMARDMLLKAESNGVPFLYVVGDSWFFCRETAELAGSLGKTWVFQSKGDRVVLMPQGWVHLSDWAKRTIPKEKFEPVKVRYKDKEHTYWCHEANLRMRSMGGERVRVVVSYDNPDLEGEPNFYCSNKLDMKADKLLNTYAKRWKIDPFYRDAKQNLGMEEYEMRKIEGVRRHLSMVFIAHTLLALGPVPDGSEEDTKLRRVDVARAEAIVETIGSRCRLAYREVLVSFIALVLRAGRKLENDAERIACLVLSSRAKIGADFAKV